MLPYHKEALYGILISLEEMCVYDNGETGDMGVARQMPEQWYTISPHMNLLLM